MSILIGNAKYKSILPNMTSDNTPSPYVVSVSKLGSPQSPYFAFDGNQGTYHRSAVDVGSYLPYTITIDLGVGNEQIVNAYTISNQYNIDWSMKNWTFEGSNDGSTYDVLHTVSNMVWDITKTYSYKFINATPYRYYRFKCSAKNGNNSICISEIQLLSQEDTYLEFNKCIESNVPDRKTDGTDSVYFTEQGNIYMTKADGGLLKMCDNADSILSDTSTNTVQNKVVKNALDSLDTKLDSLDEKFCEKLEKKGDALYYDSEKNELQLKCGESVISSLTITSSGKFAQLVPWSSGTDEQVKNMLELYYGGEVTLDQIKSVWSVGDSRNVTLSSSEIVQLTIIDFNHDTLSTVINDKDKALITVQLKDCLKATMKMNANSWDTNSWESCSARTWCNNTFKSSIPSIIQSFIKNVKKKTYQKYNTSTIITTSEDCFFLSETEIFGSNTQSAGTGEGTQYEYFKISSNRIKKINGKNNDYWFERSPSLFFDSQFCAVTYDGKAGCVYQHTPRGVSPAFCL